MAECSKNVVPDYSPIIVIGDIILRRGFHWVDAAFGGEWHGGGASLAQAAASWFPHLVDAHGIGNPTKLVARLAAAKTAANENDDDGGGAAAAGAPMWRRWRRWRRERAWGKKEGGNNNNTLHDACVFCLCVYACLQRNENVVRCVSRRSRRQRRVEDVGDGRVVATAACAVMPLKRMRSCWQSVFVHCSPRRRCPLSAWLSPMVFG